jgi:type IV secretory pathway VirB9-like protein
MMPLRRDGALLGMSSGGPSPRALAALACGTILPVATDGPTQTKTAAPVATGIDINALNFRYRIEGDDPAWRPLRAFDDGRKVFIEFPTGIAQGELPPLWVISAEGDGQLVNYRVQGNHMIVDRLFAAAELRLGGKHQQIVRIIRTDGRPQR